MPRDFFPPCRGPGAQFSLGTSLNGGTTRLPWVASRKPEERILEVEKYPSDLQMFQHTSLALISVSTGGCADPAQSIGWSCQARGSTDTFSSLSFISFGYRPCAQMSFANHLSFLKSGGAVGQSCDNSVVRVSLLCISSTCELELHSIKVFPCWAPWRVESAEVEVLFSAIMGLNKRKKANASLSSSEAELTDNEQDSHPLPPVFPRFIIIESEDENSSITSLSPFVIQKVLQSISGEPKSIKKLSKSNQLLAEVSRKAHAENLLRTQTFHNLKVRVRPHSSQNSSRGVIRCPDLRGRSEKEILDEMKPQRVTAVKRFRVKKRWSVKRHKHFCLYF